MTGKRWATGAFLVGIAMSIYGNVAHVLIKSQNFGAILFASFWPVAVFLSIEVMARVDWPEGWKWGLARFGGLGLVAAVAAITSYHHLSALLVYYGEDATVAKLGPLAPDGLMVIAAAALQATTQIRGSQMAADSLPSLPVGEAVAPAPQERTEAPRAARRKRQLATRDGQAQRKVEAVQTYQASVADGQPMSGDDLGKKYGMSGRWGRDRIREAKAA